MSRLFTLLLAFVFLAAPALSAPRPGTSPNLVMISLDGLRPDYVLEAEKYGIALPNISKLVENGARAEGVVGVLPSVTYPSHVTIITGVPPSVHGIESNYVLDVEERGQDPWYWFAKDIKVPTLISAAEERGLVTGSVSWPASIGLGADYLVPEFWRGWSRHPFDSRFMEELSTPGMIESVGRHRDKPVPGFSEMTDRDRTDIATWIIETAEPDLLLVHLFDLDFAQHSHGPKSPEAFAALETNDAMIGEILSALEDAGMLESTVIFIVSDHGFLPSHTNVAPNTLLAEEGLLRLDDRNRVTEWDAYFLCDGGSAALVLKNPSDRDLLARIEAIVRRKAAEPGSGIEEVIDAERARELGSSAPLVIDAGSGFNFDRSASGAWVQRDGFKRGNHGHAPDRTEARASLFISGAPVSTRGSLGIVRMTRIAPTAAAMLGIQLSVEVDKPLPIHFAEVSASDE